MNAPGTSWQARERRRDRRIAVRLPMQVRGTNRDGERFEENTSSENVCRGGAAFASRHELELGAAVEINIPVPKQGPEAETDFATRGRVVHVAPGRGQREKIVGVQFIGPRFHRVFLSENTA